MAFLPLAMFCNLQAIAFATLGGWFEGLLGSFLAKWGKPRSAPARSEQKAKVRAQ
jgi:hypothetical protein